MFFQIEALPQLFHFSDSLYSLSVNSGGAQKLCSTTSFALPNPLGPSRCLRPSPSVSVPLRLCVVV